MKTPIRDQIQGFLIGLFIVAVAVIIGMWIGAP